MASGQGVVEHYQRECECAWQQPCATAGPRFTPPILDTPCFKRSFKFFCSFCLGAWNHGLRRSYPATAS
jgi:hypothetical protein